MKIENQLLARLAKAVGIAPTATAEVVEQVAEAVAAAPAEAVAEQVIETLSIAIDTSALQLELDAIKAEFGVQLDAANAALAELTGKYEVATAQLAAIAAEKAELVANAAAAKLAARKEKIVAAIGTEKSDALMTATEGLDDAQFNAVVSAMAGSVEAEAKTDLFKEVGVTADADASKVTEESAEMQILKKKYPANK